MAQKTAGFKVLVTLWLVGPGVGYAALDNPDIIGGESGYTVDMNFDLLPVLVAVCVLIGLIVLLSRK